MVTSSAIQSVTLLAVQLICSYELSDIGLPKLIRVTTLGKLFTPTCLGRSQWFNDGMNDCGVRGRGQLCFSRQPLQCTALVWAVHPSCSA